MAFPTVGVGGLGATQAATAGVEGYGQGQLAARQLAYQMALLDLARRKDVGEINLMGARERYYNTRAGNTEATAANTGKSAGYYRRKYPTQITADAPDSEAIRLGRELDTSTVAMPARPAPKRAPPSGPTAYQLHSLRRQRLVGRAGYFLDQGKDPSGQPWTPQTLHDYLKAQPDLAGESDDDLMGAVHDAYRTRKKGGQGGGFLDFLKSQGLIPGGGPTLTPDSTGAIPLQP